MESGIYCNENEDKLYIVFGGKIGVIAAKDSGNKNVALMLQELDSKVEIGKEEPEEFDEKKPTIHLIFEDTKSIDVVMDILSTAKKQLEEYVRTE